VVDVGMSDDDLLDGESVLAHSLKDILDVVTGIDDDSLVRMLVTNDGAVTAEDADGKDLVDHEWSGLGEAYRVTGWGSWFDPFAGGGACVFLLGVAPERIEPDRL
jgi:hypothetical protein